MELPYIWPLFLGMTFDARSLKPGVDIFDSKYVDDPVVVEFGNSESTFEICSSLSDVQRVLEVSGELSLKIKSGLLDVKGKGSYLKNEKEFENRIEVLTVAEYVSKVESFKQGARPRDNWDSIYSEEILGTHYVDTIVYGAELIASARFHVFNSEDTQDIKAAVETALNISGNAVDLFANGTFNKLDEKLSGKANLDISYYANVPLQSVPNTLEGLETLISSFGEQVKGIHGHIPMKVKLQPLTIWAPPEKISNFEFEKNRMLELALRDFEEKFDELRKARLDLISWTKSLPDHLPREIEEEIGKLYSKITKVSEVLYETVVKVDPTQGPDQLLAALEAYDKGTESIHHFRHFAAEVWRLKRELGPKIPTEDMTGDNYIQWGNNNCTAPGTTMLYHGFIFSSSEEGLGGVSRYDCAPLSMDESDYELADHEFKSTIAGIRYPEFNPRSNLLKGKHAKHAPVQGIPCAKCHTPNDDHVVTIPASNSCPLMRDLMYSGFLMSSRSHHGHTSEYICMDDEPPAPYPMNGPENRGQDSLAFTVVKSQGSLPSGFEEGHLVRCAVCAT